MITQSLLKQYLHYDPDTGIFTWVKRPPRARIIIGSIAGYDDGEGYLRIQLFRKSYRLQRLAFLYMNGIFPISLSDHKDGNRLNNKWTNLRQATYSENCKNIKMLKTNTLGHKGIYKSGNRWIARAMHNKKFHYLGCFKTPELAAEAYKDFAKKIHGEFYRG